MVTFLAWGTVLLFVLAALHFAYESVVLPTFHTAIGYQLFALRDKLRSLKYCQPKSVDPRVFRYLEDSINGSIRYLPTIDFATFLAFQEAIESDRELRRRISRRTSLLDDCREPTIQDIREAHFRIARKAILMNNFCIIAIFIPFVAYIYGLDMIMKTLRALFYVSESEMGRIVLKPSPSTT